VIRRHTTSDSTPATPSKPTRQDYAAALPPVTVTVAGTAFPVCQSTGFQSSFDITFCGCLGCGQTDHNLFKDCPLREDPNVRRAFLNNLHAHNPQYRVKYERVLELRKQASSQQGTASIAAGEQQRMVPTSSNSYQPLLYSLMTQSQVSPQVTFAPPEFGSMAIFGCGMLPPIKQNLTALSIYLSVSTPTLTTSSCPSYKIIGIVFMPKA
jgi:hypothetical protein